MSEGWAIALLSGALVVMTGVLGWVAAELRLIHKSLRGFVDKADCREDMGKHCDRLDDLDRKVQKNSFVLSAIIQYHNSINEPLVDPKMLD